jgi:hypothetical protein
MENGLDQYCPKCVIWDEALDYARTVMVCDTCKWLSGEENNFLCHILSSETDAPYSHLKILNPKNFGCTSWSKNNE